MEKSQWKYKTKLTVRDKFFFWAPLALAMAAAGGTGVGGVGSIGPTGAAGCWKAGVVTTALGGGLTGGGGVGVVGVGGATVAVGFWRLKPDCSRDCWSWCWRLSRAVLVDSG